MKLLGLAGRGARYHWRTHAGLFAGAALGTAILVGALAVGDSVRATLRARALEGVGRADFVIGAGERSFRVDLAQRLEEQQDDLSCAAVIQLVAALATPDGARRRGAVSLYGVDADFFSLAPEHAPETLPGPGQILLNESLASRLGLDTGDRLVARVADVTGVPRELALASREDLVLALSVEVAGIVPPSAFGNFALGLNQVPPDVAFVDRTWLSERLDRPQRANLLLVGSPSSRGSGAASLEALEQALRRAWVAEDAELEWSSARAGFVELRSGRILIEDPVVRAIEELGAPALGLFTYFVNRIEHGNRSTPYSTVTGVGALAAPAQLAEVPALDWSAVLPADLGAQQIVVSDWLADDLQAVAGDELKIEYYAAGETFELSLETRRLRVRGVVPVGGLTDDPTLMPDFPGIADQEHCRDWEPGIPMDLEAIRDKDESWWDEHEGTPKAYLSLSAARQLFGSRYGALTAVRFPATRAEAVRAGLTETLDPAAFGLFFRPLRASVLEASRSPTDFGGLFLALSFFLIVAAGLLTAMAFGFSVESRAAEIGALRALGWRPARILKLLLLEGLPLAALGALLGVVLGLGYTRAVLWGLARFWSAAVAGAELRFEAAPTTLVAGTLSALLLSGLAMWLAVRRLLRSPVLDLLASRAAYLEGSRSGSRSVRWISILAVLLFVGALAIALLGDTGVGPGAASRFFGAGGLLLAACLLGARACLERLARRRSKTLPTPLSLGLQNLSRRPARSLSTMALLAFGVFLVASVVVHRRSAPAGLECASSGSGGFALMGETALPILQNPDSVEGREALALSAEELEGLEFLLMRTRAGDDASCLNLAAPRQPRLLGVDARFLAERGAFRFAESDLVTDSPWLKLTQPLEGGVVPAIGDAASLQWQMHKAVGEELEYLDEVGQPFRVRIVAALVDSVLQGSLIIDEAHFRERFPSESGYRRLFVGVEGRDVQEVSDLLGRRLSDLGLELEPTGRRLNELAAVQNTYIEIFQVLGSLGLLLGTLGLGLAVLQSTLERRSELAILRAVGMARARVRALVVSEHGILFVAGLAVGGLAAALALAPLARSTPLAVFTPALLMSLGTMVLVGGIGIVVAAQRGVAAADVRALRGE